jgi:hypothetical protein
MDVSLNRGNSTMTKIRWIIDEDRDIGISFFDVLILVKYKHSVIVEWFKRYDDAPKFCGPYA